MKLTTFRSLVSSLLLTALALTLVACETVPLGTPPAQAPSVGEAEKAEAAGDYVLAAREYTNLAASAQPPQRQSYELRAVDMLIRAGQPQQAREQLRRIDVQALEPSFGARKRILEAKLLSLEGAHEKAIRQLDEAARTRALDPALIADIYLTRSQAELALNNPIGAVRNLIQRESLIVDKETIGDNQLRIWQILNAMPRSQLAAARQLTGDALLGGWLDLALLGADHTGDDARLQDALKTWRAQYPTHPASESLIAIVARPMPEMIGRIERIALLLPLSSPYAVAAQAVRDGFLAMDAANTAPDKPLVMVYDIGADAAQAPLFYQQAVSEGAQVIVGPLGRDSVDSVIRSGVVSVPTLLLSHTDEVTPENMRYLFQFGLPPEQEARQAAERAYLDGHRQAAALYAQTPWGERMVNAFVTTWQRLGGVLVTSQAYNETDADHSEAIKQLFNLNQSLERGQRIAKLARTKLAFEVKDARPRQDIDFLFLAADAKRGRLLKPQLNFYGAGRIPVYTTSHVYTGRPDPLRDADLDGVIFGDMPWLILTQGRIPQLRTTLQGNWPHAYSDLDRLYALGMDSYAVLPQLNRLGESGARFNGVTGGLSLDRSGRLQRSLTWARFVKGTPKIIDASIMQPTRFGIEPPPSGN